MRTKTLDREMAERIALKILAFLASLNSNYLRKNIIRKVRDEVLEEMVFFYADIKYIGYFCYIYLDRKTSEKFILTCLRNFGFTKSKAIGKVFFSFKGFFKWVD